MLLTARPLRLCLLTVAVTMVGMSIFSYPDIGHVEQSSAVAPEPTLRRSCGTYTGWMRILELYAGHWDAVNLITVSAPGMLAAANLAREVQVAVLCAAPLVFNNFGSPLAVACGSGWYSTTTGRCSPTRAAAAPTPSWARFQTPGRETLVWSTPVVPDVATVEWVANQHDSAVLRPGDVTVYVIDDSDTAVSAALRHMEMQGNETLHAMIIHGPVCDPTGPLR